MLPLATRTIARAPQHTHLLLPLCLRACSCIVFPEPSISVLFQCTLGELYLWLFSFFFPGGLSVVY